MTARIRRHRLPEPIGDAWREFVRDCLDGASPVQVDEMRKAFYAGAVVTFGTMVRLSESNRALTGMDELNEELQRYRASLRSDGKD